VEENHKCLHQEEGVVVIQAIFDNIYEEAGLTLFLQCGQSELTPSGSKTKTLSSREGRLVGGRTPCAGKEE
jgi:hypothetical protein